MSSAIVSASSYNILPASTCDPWARPVPILARASPSSLRRTYHLTDNPGSSTLTVQIFPFRTAKAVTWLLIMALKLVAGLSGNSSGESAKDTGAAAFHRCRGLFSTRSLLDRVDLSRRRGLELNPRIPSSAGNISGLCNRTDRLSPEPPMRILQLFADDTSALASFVLSMFCGISCIHTILLTKPSSYPLLTLNLDHYSGVNAFFGHGFSSLDSSLSVLSRARSSAQDSVCFQACGVNVFKSR